MEQRIVDFAKEHELPREELTSPMFTCTRSAFEEYTAGKSGLRMADFYKWQRQRLDILVNKDGDPEGGQWSFDADNRKKLPKASPRPASSGQRPIRTLPT